MKKTLHLETTVCLDMFYSKSYVVSIDRIDGVWRFTDPWTREEFRAHELRDILRSVEDERRVERDGWVSRLERMVADDTSEWPVQPGETARYYADSKLIATVLCVRGGDEDKLRYLVQLHGLPAFLSTPFSVRSKTYLLNSLQAIKLQMFHATDDVAPELGKAFAQFAKEA